MHLILSGEDDAHAAVVERKLAGHGEPFLRLDPAAFGKAALATLICSNGGVEGVLTSAGADVPLSAIRTVWWRRPGIPATRPARALAANVWELLGDRFWLNPLPAYLAARTKPFQLLAAREAGLRVPETLFTNAPQGARAFIREHAPRVLYKTQEPGRVASRGLVTGVVYATVLEGSGEDRLDGVGHAACLFQRALDKAADVRIVAVGSRLFAAEAVSRRGDSIDVRRHEDLVWKPTTLPLDQAVRVAALIDRLGLRFGCVDMVRTTDGDWWFLEINPAGQWYWLEEQTGLPIAAAVARFLERGAGCL